MNTDPTKGAMSAAKELKEKFTIFSGSERTPDYADPPQIAEIIDAHTHAAELADMVHRLELFVRFIGLDSKPAAEQAERARALLAKLAQ